MLAQQCIFKSTNFPKWILKFTKSAKHFLGSASEMWCFYLILHHCKMITFIFGSELEVFALRLGRLNEHFFPVYWHFMEGKNVFVFILPEKSLKWLNGWHMQVTCLNTFYCPLWALLPLTCHMNQHAFACKKLPHWHSYCNMTPFEAEEEMLVMLSPTQSSLSQLSIKTFLNLFLN